MSEDMAGISSVDDCGYAKSYLLTILPPRKFAKSE